ncbi:MAG: 23S rRNA (pseudouridine(1915)-N(3))-methyltransferase RlmH, partial [Lachnospiraceae bacterium]|nr:23S rRNA (pseudouridine(1915)-N(3))-methyltransferase RlmH [Lachnospiraceae bacterium]
MLRVSVVCVGKLKEKYLREACAEYSKRLQSFCKFDIIEVDEEKTSDSPNNSQIENILNSEGKRILSKLDKGAKVVAMCIEGKQRTSQGLAELFNETAVNGISSVAFVIGGSWGLSEDVKKRADVRLSMSEMTFPH